ncbi:MAG: hypothetical protein ACKV2U_16095 [Bryobacteraceae bacterium]
MRPLVLAALSMVLPAQEIMPARAAAANYEAHAPIGPHTLAAEFLGRTVPAPNSAFVLQHYVVVEVALFTRAYEFNSARFSLRLNRKSPLLAQTPGMVAASLKYANWESERQITATAGVGNAGVILGRDTKARFPGDRRQPAPPPGTPIKAEPIPENAPWDWVAKLAWEDGPVKGPAGGLLYFPHHGSLAKLKTIDLIYDGPEGLVTLSLRGSTESPAKSTEPARRP